MRRNICAAALIILLLAVSVLPAAAQGGDRPTTHTVQPGETLYSIARLYNVPVGALIALNDITDPNRLYTGQVLRIPFSGESAPPSGPLVGFMPYLGATTLDSSGYLPDLSLGAADTGAAVVPPAAPDLAAIPAEVAAWIESPDLFTVGDLSAMRAVYQRGLALGNNPRAFSKIGDCNSEPLFFLAKFDKGQYDLASFGYLQGVIDYFAGSFARESRAVWTGNHAWAVFDPVWANPAACQPGETPIACEFRLNRPSVVLIRLGTNEAGTPDLFELNLRRIIEFALDSGVIPVLGTKADRIEGSDRHNEIIRALAVEYSAPLWDFGRIAESLPGRGLMADGFHLDYAPPYYGTARALQVGHPVQNLTALIALDRVWRDIMNQ